MRRGANDSNTAPMEIDAPQQHGDKKCHTCGRFGHLAKDCWQNKSNLPLPNQAEQMFKDSSANRKELCDVRDPGLYLLFSL